HGLEASLGDFLLAALADAVGAFLDAVERVLDRLELAAVAVGEDEVDLALALLAGEIVRVHALVLGRLTALFQILLNLGQELALHGFECFASGFQEGFAHGLLERGRMVRADTPRVNSRPENGTTRAVS